MRFKFLHLVVMACFVVSGLTAQEFEQSSRVLLREIRMHIVDKDGNHVPGLGPEDFSITEDGQDYKLNFFEEVDRSKSPENAPTYKEVEGVQTFSDSHQTGPRRLTLIFDSANLSPEYFEECVQELETFLFEKVDPSTLVQIIQVDGDIYPLTGYTPDRNQLREAMGKATYYGKLYKQLKSLETGILTTVSQSIALGASNTFIAPPTIENQGTLPGGMNEDAGGTFRSSVDLDVRQKAYFKQLHYRKFTVQMLRIAHALRSGKGSQAVLLVTGGQFIEEYGLYPRSVTVAETLSQAYNGVGIPLFTHLVKPKRALLEDTASIQGNLALRGGGAGWDYDSLSRASTFDASREDRMRVGPYRTTVVENLIHMEGAPRYAAEWTGGQLTIDNNTSSIDQRMVQLFEAAGKYYRLGFTRFVDDVPSVVETSITVRGAEENGWDVRYGKKALPTYGLDDRPDNVDVGDIPEKPTESISRMLHLGEPGKDDFNTSEGLYVFPGANGEGYRIPVYMRLPKPAKPAEKGYEFGFAAIAENGALLDHTVFGLDYGYDNESILFYDLLMPETKPKEIRYFIREIGGETQTFKSIPFADVEIPKVTELLLSDVANDDFVISPHHIRPTDKARAAADPLLLDNALFPFTPGTLVFNKPESVRFFFAVNDGKVGNPVEFEMWLEDQDEEEVVPQHRVQMLPIGSAGLKRFQGIVETNGLPPGNYTMYVRVYDSQSDDEFTQSKNFAVIWKENQN